MITLDSIDYSLHSIQIKDADGDALAIDASGKIGAVVEGTVELGATTLAALETITVDQGTSPWVIGDGGGSITVDGTVDVNQGTSPWVIGDGGGSITVDASQLDIDDLDYSTDNVAIKGSTGNQLVINADGSINAQTYEGGYASWKVTKDTVTNTAAQLVATPLTGRLRVEIQNLGSADIYIKQNNTAVVDGLKIPKGSSYEQALDAGSAIYAITSSGSSDVRIAEYAA